METRESLLWWMCYPDCQILICFNLRNIWRTYSYNLSTIGVFENFLCREPPRASKSFKLPYYIIAVRHLCCAILEITQQRCRTAMMLHTNYNSKIQIAQQRCLTEIMSHNNDVIR